MECPSCGAPRSDMTVDCVECVAINANRKPTTTKLQSRKGKSSKANGANKAKRRGLPAKEFTVRNTSPKGSPVFEVLSEAAANQIPPAAQEAVEPARLEVAARKVRVEEAPVEKAAKKVVKDSPLKEVPPQTSRLIEFPGVMRNQVPEWRKELSERVREVQERRAQEAAIEQEEAERQRNVAASSTNQIELLAQAGTRPLNPLVANALRRIERAHSLSTNDHSEAGGVAVAVARAPEESFRQRAAQKLERARSNRAVAVARNSEPSEFSAKHDKNRKLEVVSSPNSSHPEDPSQRRRRLIADDASNPALNYLDAVSTAPTVDRMPYRRAPMYSRVLSAIVDLLVTLLLSLPVAAFVNLRDLSWENFRLLALAVGFAGLVTFLYLTISYALAGRTLGMKLFSLRTVDARTGLIPTGGQAAGRALLYIITVPIGIGFLYALVNPEHHTLHDRLSGTAVVAT
jgi:uncharacterized RDD family membrane protein YckC